MTNKAQEFCKRGPCTNFIHSIKFSIAMRKRRKIVTKMLDDKLTSIDFDIYFTNHYYIIIPFLSRHRVEYVIRKVYICRKMKEEEKNNFINLNLYKLDFIDYHLLVILLRHDL